MCHILTSYTCTHTYLDTSTKCASHKAYLTTLLTTRHKHKRRSPGLFSCFLLPSLRTPSSAPGSTNLICKASPGSRGILDICPACKVAQRKEDEERRAHRAYQSQELKIRGVMGWRCGSCVEGSRYPSPAARKKRGGLCCEEGVRIFEGQTRRMRVGQSKAQAQAEELSRSRIPLSSTQTSVSATQNAGARGRGVERDQRLPQLQHMTLQQKARQDANRAARSYRWRSDKPLPQHPPHPPHLSHPYHPSNSQYSSSSPSPRPHLQTPTQSSRIQARHSTPLPPSLVSSYINLPGSDPLALGRGPPIPEPLYQEPGIDWSRWDTAKQGNHGRLPPMPEIPLPILPLKIKSKPANGKVDGKRRIERKPVPVQKQGMTTKRTGGEISSLARVSPLSSPVSERERSVPITPVEMEMETERAENVMEVLDGCLERALHEWQPVRPPSQRQSLASPAPVFRQTRWT